MKTSHRVARRWLTLLSILFGFLVLNAEAFAELRLDKVYPTLGHVGQDLEVNLTGAGFDENTRLSMALDVVSPTTLIGSLTTPGYARDVTVVGDKAFVAARAAGFQVIDVSDPEHPVMISSVDTPGAARRVTVVGNQAFVADGEGGLQVIDVSNPADPVIILSIDTPDSARSVNVKGDLAFVADADTGLQVITLSNPEDPFVSSVSTPGKTRSATVVGDWAFVAAADSGLQVIDVSDPEHPELKGSVDTPGDARDVKVLGNTAFVADDSGGLQVIDVSDPEAPVIVGSVETPGVARGLTVVEDRVFVADFREGLQVIDVSVREAPAIIGTFEISSYSWGVAVADDRAFVAADYAGLVVIDVSDPNPPAFAGYIETPGYALAVVVDGNKAFVADREGGLQVIDASDPEHLSILGSATMPTRAYDISVVGDLVFVAGGFNGLQVVDVIDPEKPRIIGSTDIHGFVDNIAVEGNLAVLVGGERRFGTVMHVIDVSDPEIPVHKVSVDTVGYAYGVALSGDRAFVAAGSSGFKIFDLSDPELPVPMGSLATGFVRCVTVVGDRAFVAPANSDSGLKIIDVSDPEAPFIVGSVETPGVARALTVVEDQAFVAAGSGGFKMIDVSVPENPVLIGSVNTPDYAGAVAVTGDWALVADGQAGLISVPVPVEVAPLILEDETSASATLPGQTTAGNYSLRVFNANESHQLYGAVTFSEYVPVSKAIIVAGGGNDPSNWLWEDTRRCTNYAYRALLYKGYTKENTYYLSPENTDRDGNKKADDIDGDATVANLSYAIKTWAIDPVAPPDNLLLYMTGHGKDSSFRIRHEETLSVADLVVWLDDLQEVMAGRLIFVYDACESGTFIPDIKPPEGLNVERIVMTSTDYFQRAQFLDKGRLSFSYQFWAAIFEGAYLDGAFNHGRDMMREYQEACLDANSDGKHNQKDDIIEEIVIGRDVKLASGFPYIGRVSLDETILHSHGSATIQASNIIPADDIDEVFAVITPPNYDFGAPDVPITDLPTVRLDGPDEDGTYEGTYADFTALGSYQLVLFALDKEGYMSLPESMTLEQLTGPDTYEEDDNFDQAGTIVLNDEASQRHNFHDLGDEDWVKFYGIAGESYTLEADINGGDLDPCSGCDIVIELYDSDGTTMLASQDTVGNPGADEEMDWPCGRDDIYYVKVRQYDPTVFGEGTVYDLKVYRSIAPFIGYLKGSVTCRDSEEPLENVRIKTNFKASALSLETNGYYLMVHPAGEFEITAECAGYEQYTDSVSVNDAVPTTKDIVMVPADTSCGDLNGDGECTPQDAVDCYWLSFEASWTPAELNGCDCNGDGEITAQDAVSLFWECAQ